MSITIALSPKDTELVRAQALAGGMSMEEFSYAATMKAAKNAAYLAKIDRAIKNLDEGKGIYVTDEELRRIIYGDEV